MAEYTEEEINRFAASRIRERKNGMTVAKLGGIIGVGPSQMFKYLSGVESLRAGDLYLIAEALGEPIDLFFPSTDAAMPSGPPPDARAFVEDMLAIPDPVNRTHIKSIAMRLSGRVGPGDSTWRKKRRQGTQ